MCVAPLLVGDAYKHTNLALTSSLHYRLARAATVSSASKKWSHRRCPQDTSAAAAVHVACSTVSKARAAFLTTILLSEMHEAAEAAHMNTLSTSLFSRRQARAYFSALRAAHAHLSRAPPPKPSVKEVQGPLEGL